MTWRRSFAKTCLGVSLLVGWATSPAVAGQGWYVTIQYDAPIAAAYYSGPGSSNCWYLDDFAQSPWTIPAGGIRKYTEENWSVFKCGFSANYLQLNFSVMTAVPPKLGMFSVYLADTGNGASIPAGWQSTSCPSDGKGEPTAIGWAWTDGQQHPSAPQVANCSMSNGTVTATVTLPQP